MAQLGSTIVNGSLRVTGDVYADNVMQTYTGDDNPTTTTASTAKNGDVWIGGSASGSDTPVTGMVDWSNVSGKPTLSSLLDKIYPVGCYYWSSNGTNPCSLFGGTWEQVKDRFVYAAGSKAVGTTGGEENHTLSVAELPSHTHELTSVTGYDDMNFINGDKQFHIQNSDTTVGWSNAHNASYSYGATGPTGSGSAHNNMPPYIVAYCWHRTA